MHLYATLALVAWAVVGPLASWKLTDLKAHYIDVPNARAAAAREATDAAAAACTKRLLEVEQKLARANVEAVRLAEEAERSVGPTPVEKAELQDLCNASASCRERNKGE